MRKFKLVGARFLVLSFAILYAVSMALVWNFIHWGEWSLFVLDLIGIIVAIYVSHRMVQEGWIKGDRQFPPGTAIFIATGVVLALFHGFAAVSSSMSRTLSLTPIVAIVAIAIIYVLMEWKQPKQHDEPHQPEE